MKHEEAEAAPPLDPLPTIEEIGAILWGLMADGRVTAHVNEDGEVVYRLVESG